MSDCTATGPGRLWRGDSTSLATREGWGYLAVLLDADSRRLIGCAMAEHLFANLKAESVATAP